MGRQSLTLNHIGKIYIKLAFNPLNLQKRVQSSKNLWNIGGGNCASIKMCNAWCYQYMYIMCIGLDIWSVQLDIHVCSPQKCVCINLLVVYKGKRIIGFATSTERCSGICTGCEVLGMMGRCMSVMSVRRLRMTTSFALPLSLGGSGTLLAPYQPCYVVLCSFMAGVVIEICRELLSPGRRLLSDGGLCLSCRQFTFMRFVDGHHAVMSTCDYHQRVEVHKSHWLCWGYISCDDCFSWLCW